jgi:hypothetical protein
MSYGREITGWCQLVLPTPPAADLDMEGAIEGAPDVGQDESAAAEDEPSVGIASCCLWFRDSPRTTAAASKGMLPILQPIPRIVLSSVGNVASAVEGRHAFGRSTEARPAMLFCLHETNHTPIKSPWLEMARDL